MCLGDIGCGEILCQGYLGVVNSLSGYYAWCYLCQGM